LTNSARAEPAASAFDRAGEREKIMEQASPKIRALAPFGINQPPGAGADPLAATRAVDAAGDLSRGTWRAPPPPPSPMPAPIGALPADDFAASVSQAAANALRRRGEARRDAMTAVARAMSRGGARADIWTVHAADTAYNIADMLLTVQGQEPPPLDPAYHDGEADQSARAAAVERAIRAQASPAKAAAAPAEGLDANTAIAPNDAADDAGADKTDA